MGESQLPLKGSYTGGDVTLETKQVEYADAKIDLTGLEFSIGVIFDSGQGGGPRSKEEAKVVGLPFLILPVINSRFFSLYRDPYEDLDREYILWKNAQLRTNFSWLE